MMRAFATILAAVAASAAFGQSVEVTPLDDLLQAPVAEAPQEDIPLQLEATIAPKGAMLRALDKVSGEVVDFAIEPGQTMQLGRILVTFAECRYPTNNPAGDAYAYLEVRDVGNSKPVFAGWMIATSPALNGLDHHRYDIWPLRCITS